MTHLTSSVRERARILIVDDELPVRLALKAVLSERYEIEFAEDAVFAEQILESQSIQVVLTDFNMPGPSGTDLIKSVLNKFPTTVVILLTGYTSKPAVRSASRDRDVFAVLTKPFEPGALLRSIGLAVATSHLLALQHNPRAAKPRASSASALPLPLPHPLLSIRSQEYQPLLEIKQTLSPKWK